MDGLIKRWDAVKDGDLVICKHRGVAYQRNIAQQLPPGQNAEGENYFDHYAALDGSEIAKRINEGRVALVNKYVGEETEVLDVGIGCGQFIEARPNTLGNDVNPKAIQWLGERDKLAENLERFRAFTFWDVLEHVAEPARYFKHMRDGSWLFACLPIFKDLDLVRKSKHYKPGEHLYYWTEPGFIEWMALYRWRLRERSIQEIIAGRDSIMSFAFVRDLPGYHETVDQYRQIYSPHYGATAYLYFKEIAREVIKLNPRSIIDYGCGRSDLVAHFWNDGRRRVEKYDPAIPQFETTPKGYFDLALCTDVLEHINMADVDRIFREIKDKAQRSLFTISLRPARKKLPDGRNAHVTLLTEDEWTRWVGSAFGMAKKVTHGAGEHLLMLKTW